MRPEGATQSSQEVAGGEPAGCPAEKAAGMREKAGDAGAGGTLGCPRPRGHVSRQPEMPPARDSKTENGTGQQKPQASKMQEKRESGGSTRKAFSPPAFTAPGPVRRAGAALGLIPGGRWGECHRMGKTTAGAGRETGGPQGDRIRRTCSNEPNAKVRVKANFKRSKCNVCPTQAPHFIH